MKSYIMIAALMLGFAHAAHGQEWTTVGGHAACVTEDQLDNVVRFAAANDLASIQAYLDRGSCIVLRAGVRVLTIRSAGLSKIAFIFQGQEFWTVREALKRH